MDDLDLEKLKKELHDPFAVPSIIILPFIVMQLSFHLKCLKSLMSQHFIGNDRYRVR